MSFSFWSTVAAHWMLMEISSDGSIRILGKIIGIKNQPSNVGFRFLSREMTITSIVVGSNATVLRSIQTSNKRNKRWQWQDRDVFPPVRWPHTRIFGVAICLRRKLSSGADMKICFLKFRAATLTGSSGDWVLILFISGFYYFLSMSIFATYWFCYIWISQNYTF